MLFGAYVYAINGGQENNLNITIVAKYFKKFRAVLSLVLILLVSQNIILAQDAGPDKTIVCANTTMEASGLGTWTSVPAGATILPGDINNPLAPMTIAGGYGTYTFEWTSGGTPYTVDITYSQVTIISATLSANCSSASLVGSNPGGTFTGLWTASAGGVTFSDNTATTTTASNLPVGVAVTFYWEVTKEACPQQSAGSILTNTTPVGVDAGGPAIEVCTNSTQGLSGSALVGVQTGAWTFQTGSGIFDDSTNPSATVSSLVDGVNILRWTVTEGACSAYDDVTLTNNSVTATASNQNVCATNVFLDGNQPAGTSGVWTENPAGPANIVTPTDPGTEVTSLQVGANNFRWTLTKGGCNDIVDVTITRAILNADAGTDVNNLCATSTVLNAIPAVPPATGVWSLISGSGTFADASLATTSVSGLDASTPNTFRWTVSSAGCTSVSDEVTITSNALPVDAGTDQTGVCGTSITLSAASGDPSGSGGSGVWTTGSSANILTPSNFTSTVTNLPPATSTYRWTVTKNGCSVWDEVQVTRSTYAANAGNDQTVCGTSAVLSASDPGPGGSGVWSITSGAGTITNPASRNTTVTNITSFPLVLQWQITAGACTGSTDQVTISDQGTTVAEIDIAPSFDVACGTNSYSNLASVNVPTGGETLTWYEAAPTTGVTFTTPNNITTDVNNLTVPGSYTIVLEITDGVCTNLDTVILNTYTGVVANAGGNVGNNTTCDQIVYLNAVNPAPYTGTWSVDPTDPDDQNVVILDPNNPNTGIQTRAVAGGDDTDFQFSLIWTVTNGSCTSSQTITVENYAVAYAGEDMMQCGNAVFNMDAAFRTRSNCSSGTCGTWDFSFGGINLTGGQDYWSDAEFTIANTSLEGAYPVTWTYSYKRGGSFTCSSSDELIMYFLEDLSTKSITAGADQNICGTTATITDASVPSNVGLSVTGEWSGPVGVNFSPINSPTTTISNLTVGVNTLTWRLDNSCSFNQATVDINVSGITGIDAGDEQIICEDYATFDADPVPPLGTGTWSVKSGGGVITTPTSNTSTVTSLLQGRNVFLWTVNSPFCNAVDSVVIYSGRPDQPDAGPDRTFCGSGNMQGIPPPTGTAQWSVISGGANITTPTDPNSLVTPLVSPTTLRWTVTEVAPNGLNCTNYDDVIVINNTPTTAFAGADQTGVCGSTGLAANTPAAGESGLWQTVAGTGSFADDTQAVTTVTNMQLGLNTYRWTITKGSCTSSDEVNVTSDAIVANITTPDQSTCNTSFPLVAVDPAPATGLWTPMGTPATLTSTTAFATTANGLQNGVNTFEWRVTYGACVTTDFVTINNYTITPANAGVDQSVCTGSAILSSNLPNTGLSETGTWSNPFGIPGVTFADPTSSTTSVSGLQNGGNTLRWTISNGACSDYDDVVVTVNSYTVEAGNPQAICADNTILQGSSPAPGTGVWSVQSGSGTFTTPNSSLTNVTGITSTVNVYRWTVTQGACIYTDDVTVTLNTPTAANAGLDQVACGPTATLDADPLTVGTGTWTSSSGGVIIADPTYYQSGVSNLPGGATTFTWTVTNGTCTDVDQVIIYNNSFTVGGVSPPPICVDTTELQATDPSPGTGVWTVRSGIGTFDNATYYRSIVRNIGRGDNVYRWTVSNGGCFDYVDVTITNLSVTANAGLDQVVCVDQVTLNGNNPATQDIVTPPTPATGTWTVTPVVPPITFAPGVNTYNAIASGLGPDLNTFTWTVTNGTCTDVDEVQVFNYMPALPNAGLDSTFCGIDFPAQNYRDTFELNANTIVLRTGETAYWTQVAGSSTFIGNSTDPNLVVANLEHYAQLGGPDYWNQNPTVNTYRWNVEYNGCVIWDEVTITNAAPFEADAGPNQTVCFDFVDLNAVDLGNGAQLHWWEANPPAGITFEDPYTGNPDNTPFNAHATGLQSGLPVPSLTTFRWYKENTINAVTCNIWDETEVTRVGGDLGMTTAGSNQVVCADSARMSATDPSTVFPAGQTVYGEWSILSGGGNFADLSGASTLVTTLDYDTNVFRWTITNQTLGCITTNDVYITNALPSDALAGPDQYVCTNTALLSAVRPIVGTGEWSVIGGSGTISNTTCASFNCNVYVNNMGTGLNTFQWTTTNLYTDPANGQVTECQLVDLIEVWNNSVTAEAGLDQTVCVDDAILSATQPGVGESGTWTVLGGSGIVTTPSLYNSPVTNMSPDSNSFRWTLTNGICSDYDDVYIYNNNPTDPVASTPTPNVCVDYADVNGNNPLNGTGVWGIQSGGGTFDDASSASTTVRGMAGGLNEYTWTITKNGCAETAVVQVWNRSVTADAGADIDNVCGIEPAISTVTLAASAPNTAAGESGNWTIVTSSGTIVTPTAYNSVVNNMDNGTNTFRWTISNGICNDNDLVDVFVYIPTTAVTNADFETCTNPLGGSITITANAPDPGRGTGTWTSLPGAGGAIVNPTSNVTSVTNPGYNENGYRWTIDLNGCTSSDDIVVTNNYVNSDAGPDVAICTDTYTLQGSDPTVNDEVGLAQASGVWTVTQGLGSFVDNTQYDTQVSGLTTAVTNILRWTITKGGCTDFDEVSINNNSFTIDAGAAQVVCGNSATLNGQQPGVGESGVWSVFSGGGTFVNASVYNTVVSGLSIGSNVYTWTVDNGTCTANDNVEIYYNYVDAVAGLQQRVCSTTATLDGNNPSGTATGNWVAVLGGASVTTPTLYNSGVTNLAVGQNTFQWTVSNTYNAVTCSDVSTVNIFNDTPDPAIVEADNEVCSNSTDLTVITPPAVGTGVWMALDNLAVFDNSLSFNPVVTGLNRGINTFRWTVTNQACTSTDDVIITNNRVVANAGIDKSTACADFTTLSGNNPLLTQGSGVWFDLSGSTATIVTPTLYNTSVTGLEQGVTEFRWTVSLGSCSVSDNVQITNNQITATAGVDQITCNTFYTPLDGNDVSGVGGTGVWISVGNTADVTTPTLFNTGVTNLDPGLNTFRWTVTSGAESCTDFDEVVITNDGVISNAGSDIETCNTSINLSAVAPTTGSGTWTQASGALATIVDPTNRQTLISGLTGGVYAFTWTVVNGACSASDDVVITNSTPAVSNPTTPTPETCDGTGVLQANAAGVGETGLWSGGAGSTIANASVNNTTVSGMPRGVNTYTWTLTKGTNATCTSSNSVSITNNQVVANAGSDNTTSCNDFVTLSGNNPTLTQGTGLWTDQSGSTATIVNNTLYNTVVNNVEIGTTTFRWTVSLGTCSASDDVVITNNQIVASAGTDQSTCNNFYNPLDGNDVSISGGTGVWSTTGTGTFVSDTQFNTRVNNLQSGINTLTWTVTSGAEGCTDSDDVVITYNGVTADAGTDIETCNASINLSAIAPSVGTGSWTQTGGAPATIVTSTDRQSSVTGLIGGVYSFTWTVVNGVCSASDVVNVTNSTPSVSNPTTPTPESCNGTGTLQANAVGVGETGLWSGGAGSTIANVSANNTTVSGMPRGVNTYTWTLTKGTNVTCTSSNSVSITNNQVVANAGSDNTTSCNDFVTLSGNNPTLTQGTGLWTDQSGSTATIVNNTLYNTVVNNVEIGTTTFRWTVSLGTCSASDDVVITNNQIVADAGTDQSTCSSTLAPLDGNDVSGVGGTGVWSTTGTGIFVDGTQYNTQVDNLQSGINTLTWTVTSGAEGCTDSDDVVITYNGVTSDAGTDIETCNASINLSAIAPSVGTGSWTQTGGAPATIVTSTDRQSSVIGLIGGVYSFTWTVVNGVCSASDVVNVTNSTPSVSNPTTPTPESCNGTGTLQANAAGLGETGLWSGGAGSTIANVSANNTTVSGMPRGVNTYTWTLTKGTNVTCTSANSVNITNNQVVASAGVDKTTVCNDFVTLSGSNPLLTQGNGLWTDQSGSTATIVNTTLYNTIVNNVEIGTTTFRWTVSLGTCSASDDVIITNNQIVASAGLDQSTCTNSLDPLDGNDVSGVGGTGVWSTTGTGTFVNATSYNTRVNNLQSGLNTLTWTVTSGSEGCTDSDDVIISNNSVTANAGSDIETCNSSLNLSAIPPSVGTGSWSQTGGAPAVIANSTDRQTLISGLTGGVYAFTWTVVNGACSANDVVVVTNSTPTTSNPTTPTPEVCDGNGVLQANAPAAGESGLWTLSNATGTLGNATLNNTTISGLKPGVNILRWTLSKGTTVTCTSSADVTITNNSVTANAYTSNSTSCDGNAVISGNDPLLQSATATGLWTVSTGATISNPTSYDNVAASNLAQGDNIFTWTVTRGTCTATANVTVTNNQVFATVGSNVSVCGSNATLNGVDPAPNTGVWSLETGDNPAAIAIVTPTLYNSNVTGITKTAIFKWVVSGTTCKDSAYVTVNNNSIQVSDGVPQTVCAYTGTGSLTADALTAGQSGVWTSAGSNPVIASPSAVTTAVSNLDNGSNVFFWTVTNSTGCTGSGRHEIINDAPSTPNAGTDQNICSSSTALSANNPLYGTGTWSQTGGSTIGVVISDPTSSATAVTGISPGNSTFTWTIANNACSSSDDVQIYNNSFNLSAGLDETLCGDATNFNANAVPAGGTGQWTIVGGTGIITDTTDPTSAVSGLGQGTNTFRWTVTNASGCTVSDDVQITNNQPTIPNVSANQTTCNSSITISGDAPPVGATGLWTVGSGSGTFSNASSDVTTVTGLSDNNTFIWTITQGACSAYNTVTVTYNGVVASADDDISTCSDTETLTAAVPSVGTGVWTLQSGTGTIANATLNETTVSGLSQGVNVFRWTVTRSGCSDWDEIYITNNAPDAADAGTTINTCNASFNLLANNPLVGTGTWTSAVGSSATITNPTLYNTSVNLPIQAMPYSETFTWTITNGVCTDSDVVTVNNNAFIVYANADDYTCTGTYLLTGRDPASVSGTATGNWTVISGSGVFDNSAIYNATVSSMNPEVNSFRWRINDNGCTGYDDVVIINNQVTANSTGFMTCNSNATIVANNPLLQNAAGLWTVDNQTTQVVSNPTSYNTAVSGLVPGAINRLRWTVSKGACSVSDTANIEYYVPNANITIPDIAHGCADTVQLIADPNIGTGTGVWTESTSSTSITFDDNTASTTIARNLDITDNIFIWTVTDRGCASSDQVSINNSLPINNAGTDQAGCTSTFTMNAETPTATGSGLWMLISGSVTFTDPTSPTTTVTAARGQNIVEWTITDNGCSKSKRFTITNNLTNPNAGTDVAVCENRVQLSGSALQPGQTGVWSIDGGVVSETFSSTTVNNPEVTNLRQGIITFVWTVTNGICTAEDRVVVTNNTPTVDAGPDRTICEDYVTLAGNNPDPGNTGVWTIGSASVNIVSPTAYNTSVTNLSQGSNLFTWTIDNGICTASDEVLITSNSIDVVAGIPYSEDCSDTLILDATVPPVGTTALWTAVEGGGTFDNQTSYSTTARGLTGFNRLRWTISDGTCSFFDEIQFVSLLPTLAATQSDKAVCVNYTQITANLEDAGQGESGLWTKVIGSASVTIVNPSSFQTNVTNLDAGLNQFKWTISNSDCATSDVIDVTNNQVFANAGNDQVICDSVGTISANVTTGTGYWTTSTPGVVIANSASANSGVSSLAFGNNNFQWNVSYNGCSDQDEVIIRSDLPRNVSAGADTSICVSYYNLAGSNPGLGSGKWSVLGGNGIFADDTANQTTVSGLSGGSNRFRWTVTVASCSEYDDITVTNNKLDVSAGINQTICNRDTATLVGTPLTGGVTGLWTVGGGTGTFDNPSSATTIVRSVAKGLNTYAWTLSDGNCSTSSEVEVINNTPDVAEVGADQFICNDYTAINAIAVSNGTGVWTVRSGSGTIALPSNNNTDVSGIPVGINQYTWTVTKNGCSQDSTITVTNNKVTASVSTPVQVICSSLHTGYLSANQPGVGETGLWQKISAGSGTITTPTAYFTDVTNLGNGDTYFTWTINNAYCSDTDQMRVTDNYYNTTAAPGGPSQLCQDYSIINGGNIPSGATGKWTTSSTGPTFDNASIASTYVRSLPQGTSILIWTITKDGCSSPASMSLTNNAVETNAGSDWVICGTDYILNAQDTTGYGTGYWTVDNGSVVFADSTDPLTAVSNLILGANNFTWTLNGSNGCTATDNVSIYNNQFPANAGSDQIICGSSTNLVGSNPTPGTGIWTILQGQGQLANNTNNQTTVTGLANGENRFIWTVSRNGCTDSDTVSVTNNLYIAKAGDDRAVCTNQTTITAQPLVSGTTGAWTLVTGQGTIASPTTSSTLITNLGSGLNSFLWTVTKTQGGVTCTSSDQLDVMNNAVSTDLAGVDQVTCDNFATLSASDLEPGATGVWSGGGLGVIIENPTSEVTNISRMQPGVHNFAWTVTMNGCTGTSVVQVTCNDFYPYAGPDAILSVDNYTMKATLPTGGSGVWKTTAGFANINDIYDPVTGISGLLIGENKFAWEVTSNGCVKSDTVIITYNNLTVDAGADAIICTDRYVLQGSDPYPGRGEWKVIRGKGIFSNSESETTVVSNLAVGPNTFEWVVTIGNEPNTYSESDQVTITNGTFTIDAGINRSSCNDFNNLSADPPLPGGSGVWTIVAGSGTFTNRSLNNTSVTNLGGLGTNVFRWTVTSAEGCVASDDVEITYNVPPVASFEVTPSSGCSPLTVKYTNTSSRGYTYYWNFGEDQRTDSVLVVDSARTYFAYDNDSVYTTSLVAFSDAGCSDTTVQQITVYGIPKIGFTAYPDIQRYPDATVYIENTSRDGYANYYWTWGDDDTKIDYQLETGFSHTYPTWGTYEISLAVNSGSSCNDTARQSIIIYPPEPDDKGGRFYSECQPWAGTIRANVDYAASYIWNFYDINLDPVGNSAEENPSWIFEDAGTYYASLSVIDYSGDTIHIRQDTIVVNPLPVVDFNFQPDTVMLPNQAVHFYNQTLYGDYYEWNFGDGVVDTVENPLHYYTEEGLYRITLKVYTKNKCFASLTKDQDPVIVEPAGICRFPNAFSPGSEAKDGWRQDGDVSNDVFLPVYRGVDEYKLEIFNRWGEKIFESKNPDFGWNGYVNGKLAPQDVYVWKVTGKYKNGVPFNDAGDCTLMQ